jgi:hypothetical protein
VFRRANAFACAGVVILASVLGACGSSSPSGTPKPKRGYLFKASCTGSLNQSKGVTHLDLVSSNLGSESEWVEQPRATGNPGFYWKTAAGFGHTDCSSTVEFTATPGGNALFRPYPVKVVIDYAYVTGAASSSCTLPEGGPFTCTKHDNSDGPANYDVYFDLTSP